MADISIDNIPYTVAEGKNLLEVCLSLGIKLPYFCWHPAMGSVGACRQCAVTVFKDVNDTRGRLMMACMEPVRDGLYISVNNASARAFRAQNIEWLMTNHPHDCAICDEGGACHLQDMTVLTGHAYRKYNYPKRTHLNQNLGPLIHHEMNRCIQCYRCVRYYKEYAGGRDLDVFAAHDLVYFGRAHEGNLENEFSGNLTEVCPTGVFTDKTLRQHYTRKWDMTMAPSICPHCSLGCNVIAGERYGSLRQITNRHNPFVNGYFLCDRGRYGYDFSNQPQRIPEPLIDNVVATPEILFNKLSEIVINNKLIGIGSPRASLEANFALRQLVGVENFYQSLSEPETELTKKILAINQSGTIHTPSMADIERTDAVLILGEDPTNSAPRLALSLRQALRNQPLEEAESIRVPSWNDAALREKIQDQSGPLYIAYPRSTKLDDLATHTNHLAPNAIADWAFALAQLLEQPDSPPASLSNQNHADLMAIAQTLKRSKRPLIVSGMSLFNEQILQAAYRIALALNKQDQKTDLALILPESNSTGLALLQAPSIEKAFSRASNESIDGVLVLEQDLYRQFPLEKVDGFLSRIEHLIVIDQIHHGTTSKATIVLPSTTFAESSGTLVNSEGRGQRYYAVFVPGSEAIRPAWSWLNDLRQIKGGLQVEELDQHPDLLSELIELLPEFAGLDRVGPKPGYLIHEQKIPREPHRFSGRTAMSAHLTISEPKPPVDTHSPYGFTMEGYRGLPPAPLAPYYWAPSWNSGQAVNQYQQDFNGELKENFYGFRLFPGPVQTPVSWSAEQPENISNGDIELVPFVHIFGSEWLSSLSPGIASLAPKPYLALSVLEATRYGLEPDIEAKLQIGAKTFTLTVQIHPEMPEGIAGIPYQIMGLTGIEWPSFGKINPETS
ncbi:NADH-quinone oxidoreductase subunit NuoG [Dyadobacter tibetensis]|uniref:NADH-quinone oxidoreductase subunit NuoG n=1 Tax=Dyadobacter tibetensis TaxID=1211851 RepID=UPI00046EEB33|nr:NADH-quinone oxidoreductase subunit NuoG [Dyadobacter tibetensis]